MLSIKCAILGNNVVVAFWKLCNVHHYSNMQFASWYVHRKRQTHRSLHALYECTLHAVKHVVLTASQVCMLSPLSACAYSAKWKNVWHGKVHTVYLFSWHGNCKFLKKNPFCLNYSALCLMYLVAIALHMNAAWACIPQATADRRGVHARFLCMWT